MILQFLCVFNSLIFFIRLERIFISEPFKLKALYAGDFVVYIVNVFFAAGFIISQYI